MDNISTVYVIGVRVANPLHEHPLRRYAFAWDALARRTGRHLDVRCRKGEFVGVLSATTILDCYGADPTLIIWRNCATAGLPWGCSGSRCTARWPFVLRRFVDMSDKLCGDMSVGRNEHTNYRMPELVARVEAAGFRVTAQSGVNLFWRFFQIPGLFVGGRLRIVLDRLILADGRRFRSANLFLLARRIP